MVEILPERQEKSEADFRVDLAGTDPNTWIIADMDDVEVHVPLGVATDVKINFKEEVAKIEAPAKKDKRERRKALAAYFRRKK